MLGPELLDTLRVGLASAPHVEGKRTAGWHARLVKNNRQVERGWPELASQQKIVIDALYKHPLVGIAVRPRRITKPMFSQYSPGMSFGTHVDDALMGGDEGPLLRSDVSVTVFLTPPEDYDGGELFIESTAGEEAYKLDAGSALLYSSSSLHRVQPVTRGERSAAVTWIQSYVRDPAQRELLFDLDTARRSLFEAHGKTHDFDLISRSLSNLLRMWAEP